MQFIVDHEYVRMFFLNVPDGTPPAVLFSKNAGPFIHPTNALQFVGDGWWKIHLLPGDTNTLGPLAWFIDAPGAIAQPLDLVAPLQHGVIDQAALEEAFVDLTNGFNPDEPLAELLKRPLFLFLLSLR